MKGTLLLSAIVPVFIGANLADIHRSKITVTQPTLLPSGAGVFPAGAYLAFAWRVRANDGFLDHNQAVWSAAKTTRFEANGDGKVPYLYSPSESYLIFAQRLQGKIPDRYSLAEGQCPAWFYMESRSLLRFQFTYPAEKVSLEDFLGHTAFTPAAQMNWHGITLQRGETNASPERRDFNGALWALNTIFGRDEFRLETFESLKKIPADWIGKKIIIATTGRASFRFENWKTLNPAVSKIFGTWQLYELGPLRAGEEIPILTAAPENIFIGVSAFPEWMSLQKL